MGKNRVTLPRPVALEIKRVDSEEAISGVDGPGRWLVLEYEPTALFSLKMSAATSSVGRTLVIPTPYSYKMALVDAAFRTGWNGVVDTLVRSLAGTDLRIGVPERATITHTVVKIRQEPKQRKQGVPYIPAVAYREFVHYKGFLRFALDLASTSEETTSAVVVLGPSIDYIGKRGGFVQFRRVFRVPMLSEQYTQPIRADSLWIPQRSHICVLDDFGPEANLDALNSFSRTPIRRDTQRKFVETLVPLGLVNVGPGFREYWSSAAE